MPIDLRNLRTARTRYSSSPASPKTRIQAKALGYRTAFLCHSHTDRDLVLGLLQVFKDEGLNIYVDWMDEEMPPSPNKETAQKIQAKIRELDLFLFLATPASLKSRWCPWEIGYADGTKPLDSIVVIPTQDSQGSYGNEYLELYRRLIPSDSGGLAAFQPGTTKGVWAHSL